MTGCDRPTGEIQCSRARCLDPFNMAMSPEPTRGFGVSLPVLLYLRILRLSEDCGVINFRLTKALISHFDKPLAKRM